MICWSVVARSAVSIAIGIRYQATDHRACDYSSRNTDPIVGLLMGQTAENLAFRFGITRQEMDEFSARSHARVLDAQKSGRFDGEAP